MERQKSRLVLPPLLLILPPGPSTWTGVWPAVTSDDHWRALPFLHEWVSATLKPSPNKFTQGWILLYFTRVFKSGVEKENFRSASEAASGKFDSPRSRDTSPQQGCRTQSEWGSGQDSIKVTGKHRSELSPGGRGDPTHKSESIYVYSTQLLQSKRQTDYRVSWIQCHSDCCCNDERLQGRKSGWGMSR